jgi:hypothetical protein
MLRRPFAILFLCAALTMAGAGHGLLSRAGFEGQKEKAPARVPSFRDEVQPLFQAKCSRCHGEKTRKADLDLRTPAGIRKGGESGPVIVPGKPDESLLYEKVHGGMMPPGKKDHLSEGRSVQLTTRPKP